MFRKSKKTTDSVCVICKKKFIKLKKIYKNRSKVISIRRSDSVTCSAKCSRINTHCERRGKRKGKGVKSC